MSVSFPFIFGNKSLFNSLEKLKILLVWQYIYYINSKIYQTHLTI